MARVRKKISQREALRLRKRLNDLLKERSAERNRWAKDFPNAPNVTTVGLGVESIATLRTAAKFADIFVAKFDENQLRVYAIPR